MWTATALAAAAVSILLGGHYSGYVRLPYLFDYHRAATPHDLEQWSCRPFLPNLFADTPPSLAHPKVRKGVDAVESFFTTRFSKGDIDSLSVAVVTSNGPLYERNFGVIRGNESDTSPPTTSHSMYRIASVSKLFTALEGFILEEKGLISWYVPSLLVG